jgi:hypothetical protein
MWVSRTILTAGSAAVGFVVAASGLAVAFDPWGQSRWSYMRGAEAVPALADNQGIYVDKTTFKLAMGEAHNSDPVALITKMGGKEVATGAVIFRHGDKLYIVDGKPVSSN